MPTLTATTGQNNRSSNPCTKVKSCPRSGRQQTSKTSRFRSKTLKRCLVMSPSTTEQTSSTAVLNQLEEVIDIIEEIVGDEFCEALGMDAQTGHLSACETVCHGKLSDIYRLAHAWNPRNSCFPVHTDWREQSIKKNPVETYGEGVQENLMQVVIASEALHDLLTRLDELNRKWRAEHVARTMEQGQ